MEPEPHGIYVHIPFCAQRCAYCDFAIVAGQLSRADEYVDALDRELEGFEQRHGRQPADTVYFGGGTPSLVPARVIGRVVELLTRRFTLDGALEISLEANPEDVTKERVEGWRAAGVTRVTVGVQALSEEGLASLGRPGAVPLSLTALTTLRNAGIPSLGADLIFGWSGQEPTGWREELEALLGAGIDHVSAYALETTSRTPLVRAMERGQRAWPDEDRSAERYDEAVAMFEAHGLERYEISNFARESHRSRHNAKYWNDEPYAGFGQGAASYVEGVRWTNPRRFSEYVRRAGEAPGQLEPYDPEPRTGEALVFGLRRTEGVDLERIRRRHGADALARREPRLARALAEGVLHGSLEGRIHLDDAAFLTADELFVDLL